MRHVNCDVAIIGAGTAGLHAYKAATALGADAVIIEKGEGGSTCTRTGCMPSKALIAAGRAAMQARRAGVFGVDVAGVAVDGAAVMRRVREERDYFTRTVLEQYHAIPADKRLHGAARFVSRTELAVGDDVRVSAKAVVIATGSAPSVPEALDPVSALVRTNETIFELQAPPRSMAVVGAGPLGLELAQAFARLGVEITVLDKGETAGGLADPECEAVAREALSKDFALHLGVEIRAEMADGRARLSWSGASEGEGVFDLVLAAAGRPPVLAGLDLEAADLPLDEHGVPRFAETTRRVGETSVHIAGDCGAWRPVLHEAARGGRIAGWCAAGGDGRRPLPALAVAFTEPSLVEVGVRFDALPEGAQIGHAKLSDNGRARIDDDPPGLVRLYADAAGKVLGATIVATDGEHLGQTLALAIDCGVEASQLTDQAWYHPTLEETLQDASRDIDKRAAIGA